MLFVLIDAFLDRFSPLPASRDGKAEAVDFLHLSGSSQHRLMDRYFDNASSRRPKSSAGEYQC
ncbi:MAG: hypothetical protein LDL39_00770 [Magnetospirillum sp.]|nr:hypothetical protein [Magnetospirillum sp.]